MIKHIKVELLPFIVVLIFILGLIYLMAKWTQSNVEFWATYFGNPIEFPLWASLVINIIFNAVIFTLNLLSEVIELFI